VAAGRGASTVKKAANEARFGAFAPIDCSPFIDSLFAGSPIKNRRYPAHFLTNSDAGVMPLSAA
jgi:hypothetical protein